MQAVRFEVFHRMSTAMRFAPVLAALALATQIADPAPEGRLVDLGGGTLHMTCAGRGTPVVVAEAGLGDFSFDWILVQQRVGTFTRMCTYDRAGYAWSSPGPVPRTFDQLNAELRKALTVAGERGPYVLVGHSFGGGVVRQFALRYPSDVAGLVFVDIVSEHQYISMGKHAGRIGDDAKGRAVPEPSWVWPAARAAAGTSGGALAPSIDPPYDRLPLKEQKLHAWAAARASLQEAEDSQREWSGEYFAKWRAQDPRGSLGAIPLIVLTRAKGGYRTDLDKPADELERSRIAAQAALKDLSSAGSQRMVDSGHNMHLEAPDVVAGAIRDVVTAARQQPGKEAGR
jgi:pimeloyl-ACP methyl ester carboxylesterase